MDLWLNQVWQTVVGVEAPAAAVKTEITGLKRYYPIFFSEKNV
jgi:hypothetical protein